MTAVFPEPPHQDVIYIKPDGRPTYIYYDFLKKQQAAGRGGTAGSQAVYATVADMVASTTISQYEVVETQGYWSAGDGGGALYALVDSEPAHTGKQGPLTDERYAELIVPYGVINPGWFGRTGHTVTDDTTALQDAISFGLSTGILKAALNGTGWINDKITLPFGFHLDGNNCTLVKQFNGDMFEMLSLARLSNITLSGDGGTYTGRGIIFGDSEGSPTTGQALDYVTVEHTDGYAMEFTTENSGSSIRVFESVFQRHDPTQYAIKLPTVPGASESTSFGFRRFVNCYFRGGKAFDWASGVICHWDGGDCNGESDPAGGMLFTGFNNKIIIENVRVAGAFLNVSGVDCALIKCTMGGAVTFTADAANCIYEDNIVQGAALVLAAGTSENRINVGDATFTDNSGAQNSVTGDVKTFTPTWTGTGGVQPSIGDGTLTARVSRTDKNFTADINLSWGSTTASGNGAWKFALSAEYAAFTLTRGALGYARFHDASGAPHYIGTAFVPPGGSLGEIRVQDSAGNEWGGPSTPVTPATGDKIAIHLDGSFWD